MNWKHPLLRCAMSLVAAMACAGASAAETTADAGKGQPLAVPPVVKGKCALCHGIDGKGRGPFAEQLKSRLPDLRLLARHNGGIFPVNRTYEIIEGAGKGHGTRAMPVWGVEYTVQAAEALPDLPYNQAVFVRTRIMALLEYMNQLQVK